MRCVFGLPHTSCAHFLSGKQGTILSCPGSIGPRWLNISSYLGSSGLYSNAASPTVPSSSLASARSIKIIDRSSCIVALPITHSPWLIGMAAQPAQERKNVACRRIFMRGLTPELSRIQLQTRRLDNLRNNAESAKRHRLEGTVRPFHDSPISDRSLSTNSEALFAYLLHSITSWSAKPTENSVEPKSTT